MNSSRSFIPRSSKLQVFGCNTQFCLWIAVILVANLFVYMGVSHAQGPPEWVADELLVTLRPGVTSHRAHEAYQRHGADLIGAIPQINTHVIRVPAHALEKVQRALSRRPEVEFVEKNYRFAPDRIPDDPYYRYQWHLAQIQAPQAWDIHSGSPQVIIAVLDSGVDTAHPDLVGKIVPGYNFYDDNNDTTDVYGHGTLVAGAAAAATDNTLGVASTGWNAALMPIRVTDTGGMAYSSTISQGLSWAVENGARILNLSFGGVAGSATIRFAAQYVASQGGVVVAAAGNCGCDDGTAETPYLLSVGATDSADNLAYFSTRGPFVDISAPGVSIYTTARGGGYSRVSGTSFASPVAAGVAALLVSVNPSLSSTEIMELLTGTAVDLGPVGYDTGFGAGRLDAFAAITAAGGGEPQLDTTAPSAWISAPADGTSLTDTVTVNVESVDDVSTVRVELYIDDKLLATDSSAPFVFAWDTRAVTDGSHNLQAVAEDAAGNRGISDIVAVSVDNLAVDTTAPSVSVTEPVDGDRISGVVAVTIEAADDIGVTAVEFYCDGRFLAQSSTAPFYFSWDTTRVSDGTHILQAKAYDAAGNSTSSASVDVTVENMIANDSPPSVTISEPEDGETVSKLVKINLHAVDDTQVEQLELWIDGVLERTTTCSASTCDVQVPWNTRKVPAGWHTLEAVATDTDGHINSATVGINVR